jgi:hypothetical protein
MRNIFASLIVLCVLGMSSCKKDIAVGDSIAIDNNENKAPIPPFPFSWETADYMPTPPGTPVLVPWASGSNKNYNIDIAFDFKQSDGWELVYNTFNTTALTSPSYFALYNKYRGLLRFYLYLFPATPTASTYINHGINIAGSATPSILNYTGQDIIDMNVKLRSATGIQKYQLQSTGGWYVMQYEMAYDPSITSTNYQNLDFQWYSKSTNITEVNLSGAINGTLKGTITQPASAPSLGGTIISLTRGTYEIMGTSFLNALLSETGMDSTAYAKTHQSITSALSSGIIKNIFSAIFGGSGGSTQQVSLTLNASIGLAGNMTSSTGLANTSLVIPGLSGSQSAPGFIPGYNDPMGVFYLSAKPKVNTLDEVSGTAIHYGYGYTAVPHRHTYTIDNSSFTTLFNPAVINSNTNGAHIENFQQQLALLTPVGAINAGPNGWFTSDGTSEDVGDYKDVRVSLSYSNRYQSAYGTTLPFHQTHGPLVIRFIFDVVPNNGAPRTKMVKTFYADEVFL